MFYLKVPSSASVAVGGSQECFAVVFPSSAYISRPLFGQLVKYGGLLGGCSSVNKIIADYDILLYMRRMNWRKKAKTLFEIY